MAKDKKQAANKIVETIKHYDANRRNIPTAEYQSVVDKDLLTPIQVAYQRRNKDLDPQLVWRGKDLMDWSDLVVQAPPLYIQEKIQPKVLIDDLLKHSEPNLTNPDQSSLFADFNGIPEGADKTEFYHHDQNWSNRMILGDSLQVMASLAEREGLRGKVQCIYIDPPYGIKFNSNFQWSTTNREVQDGNLNHITREPEQVKAFRDTWNDGIHSYLTYLHDRLVVARDLLTESGSLFVQIGSENVHRIRVLLDEIMSEESFVAQIVVEKTSSQTSKYLPSTCDIVLWYAKDRSKLKYRQLHSRKDLSDPSSGSADYKFLWLWNDRRVSIDAATPDQIGNFRVFGPTATTSQSGSESTRVPICYNGRQFLPGPGGWKTNLLGFQRLIRADRIMSRTNSLRYVRFLDDYPVQPIRDVWSDVRWGFDASLKRYVVETNPQVIGRCVLLSTDPGDLVLDPTCGSGTTAYVAEQWGRRWITIDTSRVALALARGRIMGARYPYYLLADSQDGQYKEAEVTRTAPSSKETFGNIRHGFVYERVPHITLKSIANNAEIDVIWDKYQAVLEPLRTQLNQLLGKTWEEWEIPRDLSSEQTRTNPNQTELILATHRKWWEARIARQKEIDASIAAKADFEYLYDKPYEDKKKVRVAGPFTVESLSPHRVLSVDENDELIDPLESPQKDDAKGFAEMILSELRKAGVQQAHKENKIDFTSLVPWPGKMVCAEARYDEKGKERRAAIFIGPEFGTVSRPDLVEAAREAGDADFDVLISCAFNYDAHSTEFDKLGRIPVLKARMNADLHMSDELKNTGKGNLFVIFGEPDLELLTEDGKVVQPNPDTNAHTVTNGQKIRVKVKGVDVFKPNEGKVDSCGPDEIACWFVDTDYNGESFFIRHAYFLGASDPYKSLKTTLKAEIIEEAWETLHSDTSRAFDKPESGRIAVKVINHLGDEVMKVFRVI